MSNFVTLSEDARRVLAMASLFAPARIPLSLLIARDADGIGAELQRTMPNFVQGDHLVISYDTGYDNLVRAITRADRRQAHWDVGNVLLRIIANVKDPAMVELLGNYALCAHQQIGINQV